MQNEFCPACVLRAILHSAFFILHSLKRGYDENTNHFDHHGRLRPAEPGPGNAVANAPTPIWTGSSECPGCKLSASGLDVGLPEGQMGNSEVGHTNIGAGRVVFQDLPRISRAIETASSSRTPPIWRPWTTAGSGAPPCT